MSTAGPELRARLKRVTPFSTLRNTGTLKAAKAPIAKRIGHGLLYAADAGENHLTKLGGKAIKFALKRPLLTAGGLYVGHKIHQELKAEMQAMKDEGLQLGFLAHAIKTIARHAPRIAKTTYGAGANSLRRGKAVAKSFFNKSTAMGRAAFKVAKKGLGPVANSTPLRSGIPSGPSLARTAWRHKGKIAVGLGAGAAIRGATSVADPEPKAPTVAPIRMKIANQSRIQ